MKLRNLVLILTLAIGVLAGCTSSAASPAPQSAEVAAEPESNTTARLDTSYEGALSPANQLALGTFLLEETADAVTPQQAKSLLPLWQATQGGTLQGSAEIDAVLGQIEKALTTEQVAAIATRALTNEDLQIWAQENGLDLGPSPEAMAALQAEGGVPADLGKFADMSEEDRAAMRATAQAGGLGGPGQGGDMSAEDREARRATAEASGVNFGARGGGGGVGQLTFLAGPLVELLTERAAG